MVVTSALAEPPFDQQRAYRVTVADSAVEDGKIIRQIGEQMEYAHVRVAIDPLPRNQGIEVCWNTPPGCIPAQFVSAVMGALSEAIQSALRYPLTDVRAAVIDGSYHETDSNVRAFADAVIKGLKAAVAAAQPVVLEPIHAVLIDVPEEFAGATIATLNKARGRIDGVDSSGTGTFTIKAQVPEIESRALLTVLLQSTLGRVGWSSRFLTYEPVPRSEAGPPSNWLDAT